MISAVVVVFFVASKFVQKAFFYFTALLPFQNILLIALLFLKNFEKNAWLQEFAGLAGSMVLRFVTKSSLVIILALALKALVTDAISI